MVLQPHNYLFIEDHSPLIELSAIPLLPPLSHRITSNSPAYVWIFFFLSPTSWFSCLGGRYLLLGDLQPPGISTSKIPKGCIAVNYEVLGDCQSIMRFYTYLILL